MARVKTIPLLAFLCVLSIVVPAANAEGEKPEVSVETDAANGSVTVTPKKCYRKGVAFTWTICPKIYQQREQPPQFFLLILFTQRSAVAFPAFTRAEITMTVDGGDHKTGDLDWTADKIGRYALIPTNKDYLQQIQKAHDISFSLQLSGKRTRSDIRLDSSGLQTLQAACSAILNYSQ